MGAQLVANGKLPEIVYHYCGPQTFQKIVKNRTLWLTDSRFMNDYWEREWLNQLAEKVLEHSSEIAGEDLFLAGQMYSSYTTHYDVPIFLGCFSGEGDLLSQWRAYASDGSGVALGFSLERLRHLIELSSDAIWDREGGAAIFPVIYDEEKQLQLVRDVFRTWSDFFHSLPVGDISDSAIDQGAYILATLSRILKNPGFREEREWRLIYVEDYDQRDEGTTPEGIERRQEKFERNNQLVPYHRWHFDATNPLPLREIVIGPKNRWSRVELKTKLEALGLPALGVRESSISYR